MRALSRPTRDIYRYHSGRPKIAVLIRQSVHIQWPVTACADALLDGPRKWFPRLSEKNVGVVAVHIAGLSVHKRVVVGFGNPVRTATWTVIPINWKATFPGNLFPKMVGRIELAPVDTGVTRLTVSGKYRPPFGRLGKRLDEAFMFGVADSTFKQLAESIASRIEIAAASRSQGVSAATLVHLCAAL